jgi:Mu-like prophage I protein
MNLKQFVTARLASGMTEGQAYKAWRGFSKSSQLLQIHGALECSQIESKRFRKEVIKVGKYQKGETKFEVDAQLISHWAETGNLMLSAGNKIPIPGSDHIPTENNNHGFVTGFEIGNSGNSLFATMDIVDESPDRLVMSNDVSVYVPAKFTDGNGKTYLRPVTHISLTPTPVIPGLADFQAIAASFEYEDTPVEMEPSEMDINKIAVLLGIEGEATEEAVALRIAELVSKCSTAEAVVEEVIEAVAEAAVEVIDAEVVVVPVESAPIEASHSVKADPRLVKAVTDATTMRLDSLISNGCVSVAVGTQLKKRLDAGTLALSVATSSDSVINDLLLILSHNKPVAFGEKTQAQILASNVPAESTQDPSVAALMSAATRK